MTKALLFDFVVDKSSNTVTVVREFAADQSLLWDSFTKKELLDQWWAPAPWTSKTTVMNFEEGGKRIYAMCGPEGEEHWAVQTFTDIKPIDSLKYEDAFSDKEGNEDTSMPSMHWELNFSGGADSSKVDILITLKSLEDLERIIEMGFKEGFTQTLNALADQLQDNKK